MIDVTEADTSVTVTQSNDILYKESNTSGNLGLVIGVFISILVASLAVCGLLYRQRTLARKNAYITFGNPTYSREHLPSNDYSLESPLTLSSSGYTVLA